MTGVEREGRAPNCEADAETTAISQDAAITLLFDQIADRKGPARQRGPSRRFVSADHAEDEGATP
jgi:hypothetical protein